MHAQLDRFSVQRLCQVLGVARSGFYQWTHEPLSPCAIENERLLESIRESYVANGKIYGTSRALHQ
jgi:putative transposase